MWTPSAQAMLFSPAFSAAALTLCGGAGGGSHMLMSLWGTDTLRFCCGFFGRSAEGGWPMAPAI